MVEPSIHLRCDEGVWCGALGKEPNTSDEDAATCPLCLRRRATAYRSQAAALDCRAAVVGVAVDAEYTRKYGRGL